MGDYRINYGNGQVSGTTSKAKAIEALRLDPDPHFCIQTWDMDGEWHRVRISEKAGDRAVYSARHGKGPCS
jgi:hypothetical protein